MDDTCETSSNSSSNFSDLCCDSDAESIIINEDDFDDREEEAVPELEGIEPYRFEPDAPDNVGEVLEVDPADPAAIVPIDYSVLDNWCTCHNCQVLPKGTECVCCLKIDQYHTKWEAEPQCIAGHEGFDPVCTNNFVLETAWYQYRTEYGKAAYDGPKHKKLRHIAYRQLVRWVYGFVGKDIRVVLPSCAVCKIRAFFPPPEQEDVAQFVGFLDVGELEE